MKILALLAVFLALPLFAQTTPPANIYAAGASYNNSGTPAVDGTALYAHLVNDGSGTYVFTIVDALPQSVKPLTVTTNVGAGIAQKIFSAGPISVYVPTSAGISWTGSNTGWAWTTGGMATIPIKSGSGWFVGPNVRVLKSSVAGGTGYQLIGGVMVGWGK
jgi:hypothetical protein